MAPPNRKKQPDSNAFLLKRWRENNNLTQTQVADELGISQVAAYYLETGKRTPSRTVALAIDGLTSGVVPHNQWTDEE